mmetsp:Transcript_4759/g.7151  ORF Transcript_4759/g.7151 Transcript_4759/m.7151 type:complete len:498 (-) Transcript_4759:28-1521(-)
MKTTLFIVFLCCFVITIVRGEESSISQSNIANEQPNGSFEFFDNFQNNLDRWFISEAEEYTGNWRVESVQQELVELEAIQGDKGLVMQDVAAKHGIFAPFDKHLSSEQGEKDIVVQYEVRFQREISCGGAYLKLVRATDDLVKEAFSSQDPYVIMFGPDKCGSDNKLHFIVQHQNPVSLQYEEKHLFPHPTIPLDGLTHLYTLHIHGGKENTFTLEIDHNIVAQGSFLNDEHFTPSFNPPRMIDDPEDVKPNDWVDEPMMDDPKAVKPDDWVDEPTIPDPEAVMPQEWDDELDGEWEPPQIFNPDYVGEWEAPQIENPDYVGEWTPRQIENPTFFQDDNPAAQIRDIAGLGFELWTMTEHVMFDNILVTHSREVADDFASRTFDVKSAIEQQLYEKLEEKKRRESAPSLMDYINMFFNAITQNAVLGGLFVFVGSLPVLFVLYLLSKKKPPQEKENNEKESSGSSTTLQSEKTFIEQDTIDSNKQSKVNNQTNSDSD